MYRIFLFFHIATAVVAQSLPVSHEERGSYNFQSPDRIEDDNFDPAEERGQKYFETGSENDEKESAVRKPGILDPEVADQLEGNGWLDVIPGIPGKDYPNYDKIPKTSFSCYEKTAGGYYADIEARCQVFHVCNTEGQKVSFMCPSGSIFNQKYFVCDWWYDFECDDATDLYSLNDKVNRGGTGSGPGGPGRIQEEFDYPSEGLSSQDLHTNQERFQTSGAGFLRDEVPEFDLSLAGTGEGGPGYARRGNSRGYQSNVNDKIPNEDKKESKNSSDNRKIIESVASKGETQFEQIADKVEGSGGVKKSRGKFLNFAPSANGDQDRGGNLTADVQGNGQNFRRQNSPLVEDGISNGAGNYQSGNINTNSNDAAAAAVATDNFRNIRGHSKNPREDRTEKINPTNENVAKKKEEVETNGFGERPGNSFLARDNNHRHFSSGTSEEREGEFVTQIPDSAKQSQRQRNTYLNYKNKDRNDDSYRDGDFQNSGGSKNWGDRKIVETSGSRVPGEVTEVRSPLTADKATPTDLDYQKKDTRISDFKDDDNNFAPSGSGLSNSYDSRRHTSHTHGKLHSLPNSSTHRNNDENFSRLHQRPQQSNAKNHRAGDYLLGVVPGEENTRNGNERSAESNEQPRFLPIL